LILGSNALEIRPDVIRADGLQQDGIFAVGPRLLENVNMVGYGRIRRIGMARPRLERLNEVAGRERIHFPERPEYNGDDE
jgi:hypothetical protein